MVLREALAARLSANASLRSKVSRLSANCSSIRVSGWKLYSAGSPGKNRWTCFCTGAAYGLRMHFHTLIGVSFTYGRTFFFLLCFAACIRVRFLYCWSCFYEIVFSFSAVVFVFVSYSFSDGGLCALVTCLPPRPFFGCPRRDCNVSMDICRFILFHVHSTGNELHVTVEDM